MTNALTRNFRRHEIDGRGGVEDLSPTSMTQIATDWSRDGQFILYYSIVGGVHVDLWSLRVAAGSKFKPEPYLQTEFTESWGRFVQEPTPRWIAYQSNESGRFEIYVDSFPKRRAKTRVSTAGGQFPQWGPGGRELFYMSPDNKLMAASIRLGPDSLEATGTRELFPLPLGRFAGPIYDVSLDGQRFLVDATLGRVSQPLNVIVNWPALFSKHDRRGPVP
jgi:eukaryotic-like serine/threonine-protein kinase